MLLSISRRTDIPNYYPEWVINRVKEGYLYVRNPMNAHQISKLPITSDIVDCIVFWTKNPKNILLYLDDLKEYQYYFQYTLDYHRKAFSSIAEQLRGYTEKVVINCKWLVWMHHRLLGTINNFCL